MKLVAARKSSRPAHQFALPLKAVKSPHQHGECGNRSTLLRKSKREERKGSRGGNCLKGWMLAVRRGSGALVPNISGFDGLRLRAATKAAAARKRPCHSGGCRTVGIVGADHKRKLSIKGGK